MSFPYNNLRLSLSVTSQEMWPTQIAIHICTYMHEEDFLNSTKVEFITQTTAHYPSGLVSLLDSKDCGNLYTLLGDEMNPGYYSGKH